MRTHRTLLAVLTLGIGTALACGGGNGTPSTPSDAGTVEPPDAAVVPGEDAGPEPGPDAGPGMDVGFPDTGPLPDGGPPVCPYSGPCNPYQGPCMTGTLGCDALGNQVCVAAPVADGTSCGPSKVCKNGGCGCNDTCTVAGARRCDPAGGARVLVCERDGTTGCLSELGSACASGESCNAGSCISACPAPVVGQVFVNPAATAAGNGSSACPFKTIGAGVEAARLGPPGTQVNLAPGSYGAETFPLHLDGSITVLGAPPGASNTEYRIAGAGTFAGGTATIVMTGSTTLNGVTLEPAPGTEATAVGVWAESGTPRVLNTRITSFAEALHFGGSAQATVGTCLLTGNSKQGGSAALHVNGSANVTVSWTDLTSNFKDGALVEGAATVDFEDCRSKLYPRQGGLSVNTGRGLTCKDAASVKARNSNFYGNGLAGAHLEGSCTADLSGQAPGPACGRANAFGCNNTSRAAKADVESSSTVPVNATMDKWKNDPPVAGTDYAVEGPGVIDASAPCGLSGC